MPEGDLTSEFAHALLMLDHVSLGVCDIERSKAFYDAALAPLGYVRVWSTADSAGYGVSGCKDEPFAIRSDATALTAPRGCHIAFAAKSREAVRSFHAAAMAQGAADDGAPGLHHEYGVNYFAAFILDPDGYRLEAVYHEHELMPQRPAQ
jgi:catechol 2,3-dioxygenase-like lactoylglutathione lyase family enzyme